MYVKPYVLQSGPGAGDVVGGWSMSLDPRRAWVEERLADLEPEALFLDGHDAAIAGYATQFTTGAWVVYDRQKLHDSLVAQGMTDEEAEEWFSFNIEGAWVGDHTPLILYTPEEDPDGSP